MNYWKELAGFMLAHHKELLVFTAVLFLTLLLVI